MEQDYRRMFEQAVRQAQPDPARTDALRAELAQRCAETGRRTPPGRKRGKLLRNVLVAAAVAAALTVTVAAEVIARQPVALVAMAEVREDGCIAFDAPVNVGVYRIKDRYYLQVTEDGEPIDITGQFSETVPYVYVRELDGKSSGYDCLKYVLGGSGDRIAAWILMHDPEAQEGDLECRLIYGNRVELDPIWWRTYCYENYAPGTWRSLGGYNDRELRLVMEGWTADAGAQRVTITVKGEEVDITQQLSAGELYILPVEGEERSLIGRDETLIAGCPTPWDMSDPEVAAKVRAYEDSAVYGYNRHEVLACRDGDQVRYAEFVYTPEGRLQFWMPFNCPSAAQLDWLEGYVTQHGWTLDKLMKFSGI